LTVPCVGAYPSFPPSPARRSSDLVAGLTIIEHPHPGDAQDGNFALSAQRFGDGLTAGVAQVVLVRADEGQPLRLGQVAQDGDDQDRKSTRLNSSHVQISYAVFCLK